MSVCDYHTFKMHAILYNYNKCLNNKSYATNANTEGVSS